MKKSNLIWMKLMGEKSKDNSTCFLGIDYHQKQADEVEKK